MVLFTFENNRMIGLTATTKDFRWKGIFSIGKYVFLI